MNKKVTCVTNLMLQSYTLTADDKSQTPAQSINMMLKLIHVEDDIDDSVVAWLVG